MNEEQMKHIANLISQDIEKDKEIEKLNRLLNQADSKNLELIELINKIYDIIENEKITGIEARLMIQDILQGSDK